MQKSSWFENVSINNTPFFVLAVVTYSKKIPRSLEGLRGEGSCLQEVLKKVSQTRLSQQAFDGCENIALFQKNIRANP